MLGLEVSPVVQYVIAFAIIAALLGLFAIVLRRIGGKRFALPGQDRGRGRQPRLGIVDVYDLDRQRQLVLLRRDNVEHLVMLGGPNDLVVESNIVRVPAGRALATGESAERVAQTEPGHEQWRPQAEPAIAASAGVAVNGLTVRDQASRDQVPRDQLQREPSMQQRPQALPANPPQPQPEPQTPPRLEPVQQPPAPQPVAAPQPPRQPVPQPSTPQSSAPQPSTTAPAASPLARPAAVDSASEKAARGALKPVEPVVTAAPPPPPEPKRGLFGFGRAVEPSVAMPAFPSRPRATPVATDFTPQRTPPKFAPAGEEFAPAGEEKAVARRENTEKAGGEGDPKFDPGRPGETPGGEKPAAPEKVSAPVVQSKPGSSLDDAILSDMTRQLEAALKRPGAAVQSSAVQSSAAQSSAVEAAAAEPSASEPSASAPQPAGETLADGPSEPKLYNPVATAAAATATTKFTPVFRSGPSPAPTGPSSPVPPRPYGGADKVEPKGEVSEPVGKLQEKLQAKQEEKPDVTLREAEVSVDEQKPVALEPPVEISNADAREEPSTVVEGTTDDGAIEIEEEDRLRELPPETIEPVAPDTEEEPPAPPQGEGRGEIEKHPAPAPEAIVEAVPETADDDRETSEEHAGTSPEAASEQRKEPTPVIDPFSVDEIEAEFARLLGRSVEKDQKNP